MSKLVIFKGKVPTPYMRFFDRNSFDAWLMSQNDAIEIEVSGVNPYTTLYYIDVNLEDKPEYKSINWQSEIGYIKVVPDLESQTFFAFVDRVERNELDENSTRIYYKVDWWDTLLKQGDEPFIVGDVVRAHVNDIVNREPTLDYTTEFAECDVNKNQIKTSRVLMDDLARGENYSKGSLTEYYLHLIVSDKFFSSDTVNDRDKLVPSSPVGFQLVLSVNSKIKGYLYEVILPCNSNGEFVPYYIDIDRVAKKVTPKNYDTFPSAFVQLESVKGYANRIRTDYIAAMYLTTFAPTNITTIDDGNNSLDYFRASWYSNLNTDDQKTNIAYNKNEDVSDIPSASDCPVPVNRIVDRPYVNSADLFYDISGIKDMKQIEYDIGDKPINFNDYKNKYIVKYLSEYYNPIIIKGGDDVLELHHSFANSSLCVSVTLDSMTGDSYVFQNVSLLDPSCGLSKLSTTFLCQPIIVDKYWDRQISKINATKNLFNTARSSTTYEKQGGTGEAISAVGNAMVNMMEFTKNIAFANGALSKGQISESFTENLTSLAYPYFVCCKYSDDETLENLVFYGYNTHLQPYEILKNHKRKYFNFVKTSSCNIINIKNTANGTYRNYSAEVRNDIESMFNGGVWLFNFVSEEDLFNLEVPNYPLSAGY